MTVENFLWSISTKECRRPRRTLDYYVAKVEPYMFKHNKHEEEQEKEKKRKKHIIIIYFINDKEEEKN